MSYPPAHKKGPAICTYGADGSLPWPTTILSVKPRLGRDARGRVAQDGWLYTVWSRDKKRTVTLGHEWMLPP